MWRDELKLARESEGGDESCSSITIPPNGNEADGV